jgi:hypothetical protein
MDTDWPHFASQKRRPQGLASKRIFPDASPKESDEYPEKLARDSARL